MPYTHLTENKRHVISHLNVAGFTFREIARRIRRHHTTVSREFKRNGSEYDCSIYWYDLKSLRRLQLPARNAFLPRRATASISACLWRT